MVDKVLAYRPNKSQMAKRSTYTIRLTEEEWKALKAIVRNGWGDGDYQGYGRQNPQTQIRAMKKLDNAQPD